MKAVVAGARRRAGLVGAAVALAGLPVVIGVPATPAAAAPSAPNCATRHLGVFLGGRDNTAGASYYRLRFKNFSHATCVLTGYPGVSAISKSGQRLGSPAGHDTRYSPRRVRLQPHESAATTIRVTDVANYPKASCRPTRAYGLRVFPPNQKKSVVLKFRLRVCAKPGHRYMSVQVVRHA